MTDVLSPLQRALLEAFFRRAPAFYLTGGAALAGFYLGHRRTEDLDLFTTEDAMESGERALQEAAEELGASVERLQTTPDFRRRLVRRGNESLVADLVRERVMAGQRPKIQRGTIRLDSAEEILANKLCALLSRSEVRDLVDVMALKRAGVRIEDVLPDAMRKDGGLTPAQLAWVLSELRIGDDARIPGNVSVAELRTELESLIDWLTRLAAPSDGK
jgi:predicted nucleotidyltransferase component of viral defense system